MKIGFTESTRFSRKLPLIATDSEYQVLQSELRADPERGVVIPGAGGTRKIRLAIGQGGKRGGARVIYYPLSLGIEFFFWIFMKKSTNSI